MHIVIPMSGVGSRFKNAGYKDPKPLIRVDGKPIIEHVVELFPGETKFTFICNDDHLETTPMRSILERIAPGCRIVSMKHNKKGPVDAVARAYEHIDDDEEVIVNYCDFGTYWDYADFLQHTRRRKADGAVPAYKGFHPHMLGTTNYAFMRDTKQWMEAIQEKQPFTDNRMQEYASNGTYYFRNGAIMKKYFNELMEKDMNLNGEFYVSMVYNLLVRDGLKVSIYEIQHMLQWGTPSDLEEYNEWSKYFSQLTKPVKQQSFLQKALNLIPLAGKGRRFAQEGYKEPKPLVEVNGRPMVVQAARHLPLADQYRFVCLQEHLKEHSLANVLQEHYPQAEVISLADTPEGQAIASELGLEGVADSTPLHIAAFDNGMLWNQQKYQKLLNDKNIDAIVWSFRNHPSAKYSPTLYGWLKTKGKKVRGVSVNEPVSQQPEKDHAIVGTFFFRKTKYFRDALASLLKKNIRINDKYYVESLIAELVEQGKNVVVFPVDFYVCWKTPNDLKTYLYWQSFFHKCPWHPYRLDKDTFMNDEKIAEYETRAYAFRQAHP